MALPTILGGVAAAGSLFSYNRKNFMFDKEQQLKREYQGQDMRIKQFELYREDIRDLVELTVGKMDNYLLVNTLQICFTVILFTEGKPHPGKWQQHLHWLYSTCNVGAFTYFLLSVWLAMHASIAAHSFGVRLLTQFVRLPVPNKHQLDAARAKAEDYEAYGVTNLLRIPLVRSQFKRLTRAMDTLTQQETPQESQSDMMSELDDSDIIAGGPGGPQVASLRHVQLYRELQANWQSYDAYARVCMSMGTNQLLHALGYYCLGMLVAENRAPWPGFCCVVIFTVLAWLIMRLDLYLTRRKLSIVFFLIFAAPILTMVTITIDISTAPASIKDMGNMLIPPVFALHVAWIVFIIRIAQADTINGVALPTQFRAVTYLDVFGWLGDSKQRQQPGDDWRHDSADFRRGNGGLSVIEEMSQEGGSGISTQPLLPGSSHGAQPSSSSTTGVRFQEEPPNFNRQISGSSVASSTTRRLLRGGQNSMPMRIALISACRKLKDRLAEDFQRWDDSRVRQLLAADPFALQAIAQLRERFNQTCGDLELAEGEHAGVELGTTSTGSGGGSFDDMGNRRRASSTMSAGSGSAAQPVWLQLEWAANGRFIELFFSCETGDTSWTRPEDARVSNTFQLEERLTKFSQKVCALADFVVEQSADSPANGIRLPSDLQAAAAAPAMNPTTASAAHDRAPHQTSASASDTGSLGGRLIDSVQALTSDQPENESAAQETRFGGGEAVQLAEHSTLRETFFAAGAQAGPTFYPQQPGMYGQTDHVAGRRRQPGQMPWNTFFQGSLVLTAIWAIGFCWSIFHIFDYDIPLTPVAGHGHGHGGEHEHGPGPQEHAVQMMMDADASGAPDLKQTLLAARRLPRLPKLVYQGDWPHPFFSPRGLACHPGVGSDILLIAEKYSVHELHLGTTDEASSLRPVLAKCLADAPDFQASGIQSISLECAAHGHGKCTALLFGAAGQGALRCNFARELEASRSLLSFNLEADVEVTASASQAKAEVDVAASATIDSQRITVHGRHKWRALAAGSSETFWALADGALVQMRHRANASAGAVADNVRPLSATAELVPQVEVPHAMATKSTQVHVISGIAETRQDTSAQNDDHPGVVLTLESNGLLRAVPLEGGTPSSWWLPTQHVVRWTGVCATGGKLFLSGVSRYPERTASIWSVGLSDLSSLKQLRDL